MGGPLRRASTDDVCDRLYRGRRRYSEWLVAAAANGSSSTTGSGAELGYGGEANVSMTSFPDYVDPQLSYTLEGWEVLYNVYTPLLTYKHAKGKAGTEVVPGLAKDMPEISADGKTYKLKLRPNMKYSDGTPIKASDFTYAIQRLFKADSGGSVFFDADRRRHRLRRRQGRHDQRHHHRRQHRRHHHHTDRAQRHLRERARPDVRRAGAADHAAGQGRDQQAAAGQRSVHDHARSKRRRR